ncbi:MAG: hypothetical protein CMJ77_22945 [Planctomycetaceae bacterium]|nr:hypothetical protein [Planctomycetaceae bacterium]
MENLSPTWSISEANLTSNNTPPTIPFQKKFIYLQWPRNADVPKSVSQVWDHDSGQTIKLYQFPDIKHPLPVIPSMEAMKFCPATGDGNFKAKPVIAYD